jgi:protein-S-isoprenylcysteine O-methyltransferase Ste14
MKKIVIPPVFVLFCCLCIILFSFEFRKFNLILFPYNLGGLIIFLPGFYCMGITRMLFKKHSTTLFIEKSSSMITEGIFCKTRNPMYVGMFLVILGIAILSTNIFSLIMPFVFFLLVSVFSIPLEEKLMLETFGQDYINYKNRVPRWF